MRNVQFKYWQVVLQRCATKTTETSFSVAEPDAGRIMHIAPPSGNGACYSAAIVLSAMGQVTKTIAETAYRSAPKAGREADRLFNGLSAGGTDWNAYFRRTAWLLFWYVRRQSMALSGWLILLKIVNLKWSKATPVNFKRTMHRQATIPVAGFAIIPIQKADRVTASPMKPASG